MNERKDERLETINLLDYAVVDADGKTINRSMGRTLNVSEKGILLDTHIPFEEGQDLVLSIEFEHDIVDLKGKVVHTEGNERGRYSSGILFEEMDRESNQVLQRYLKSYQSLRTTQ